VFWLYYGDSARYENTKNSIVYLWLFGLLKNDWIAVYDETVCLIEGIILTENINLINEVYENCVSMIVLLGWWEI